MQAYLLALPAVNQAANRNAIREVGPANTTVPIFEQLIRLAVNLFTANDNTVYSWTWLDLHSGPLVVEVPPKVLGAINDMWYRWSLMSASPGRTGQGRSACCRPVTRERYRWLRTSCGLQRRNWIPWRSFLVNGDPKPGVDLVKKFTRIYPLSQSAQTDFHKVC